MKIKSSDTNLAADVAEGAGKSVDPNKLNHIFGKSEHNLGGLLKKYGDDQTKAFNALESATQKYVNTNNVTGNFKDIVLNVNGVNVTVRGTVIEGRSKLESPLFLDERGC